MTFPLEGVRVLDLTRLLTGPVATMLLADHGAEVIKIEMPPHGDGHRKVGMPDEFLGGEGMHFLAANRNKKSILLNLKDPNDLEVFYGLVKKSDVVFDNYRPGVLKRLRIDHATLKQHNPAIISCSISGFGETSSEAQRPAFDPIIQALSGFMSVTRDETGRPIRTGVAIGDLFPSVCAAYGVSLALHGRAKTGRGCRIDISMLDCLVGLLAYYVPRYLANGYVPKLSGGHVSVAPWGSFKTGDGYIVLAIPNDGMFRNFCSIIGRPQLAQDERFDQNNKRKTNERELNAEIDSALKDWSTVELEAALMKAEVVCARVQDVGEVLESRHVADRKMVVHVEHPKAGRFGMAANFIKSDMTPYTRLEPPPEAGQHTDEVLMGLLGYSKEQLQAFKEHQAKNAPKTVGRH